MCQLLSAPSAIVTVQQLLSPAQTTSRVFVLRPVYILRTVFSCGPLSFGFCCIMLFLLCKISSFHRPQAWRWNVSLLPSAGNIQPWEKRTDCLKGQKTNLTQKIIIITTITIYAYKTDSFQFVEQWIKNKQTKKDLKYMWSPEGAPLKSAAKLETLLLQTDLIKILTLICLTPV